MAAGTGGSATLDTTGEYIFGPTTSVSDACTSLQVWNEGAVTTKLLVGGLHDSGAELELPAGKTVVVRRDNMGIKSVFAKAASSTCAITWGVVARTSIG